MALPNPGMDAVPFTPLTAEFLDDMIENIESLADGTGIGDKAVTALKIDFTTLLAWVPDYANMDSTSRGSTWTVVSRGFVKLYSSDRKVGSVYDGEPFEINGKKVGRMAQEAQSASGNGARMATLSGIFPVTAGDNVKVIGANDAQIFFIPGRWI